MRIRFRRPAQDGTSGGRLPAGASGSGIAGPLVRLLAAVVFVSFGVGKFTSHAGELASFRGYGLPWPDAFVYVIGVVEIGGGLLLLCGLATMLASLVLAANMLGAIVVSGIGRGERISLTLAPVMLAAMIFLLWRGPGRWTLGRDARSR